MATIAWLLTSTDSILKYHTKSSDVSTGRRDGDTPKIVWESGMCTQNRGINNLHRIFLLKISDVYTGFVEIGGRE